MSYCLRWPSSRWWCSPVVSSCLHDGLISCQKSRFSRRWFSTIARLYHMWRWYFCSSSIYFWTYWNTLLCPRFLLCAKHQAPEAWWHRERNGHWFCLVRCYKHVLHDFWIWFKPHDWSCTINLLKIYLQVTSWSWNYLQHNVDIHHGSIVCWLFSWILPTIGVQPIRR